MKKTPRVDRYDPIIYPRKLWVTGDVIGLNKIFKFNKLDNTKEECASAYDELVEEYNTTKAGCISKTLVNIKREYDTRRESDDVEA